ncbi:TPA: hypothetical protein N0F65_000327 [Lagenidium giganteum]|uniref:HECT-type E3 ubiquitin transferase n=1 Tax=Lagenidium giganteum TaxID=4803 RepID=A0AAV2YNP4_9STRA|nr:TPA: hypothetical protein N0F65_000327 [Lagenidium giganteum]
MARILAGVLAGVVVIGSVSLIYCCCKRRADGDGANSSALLDNLLRREQLESEGSNDGADEWQCVVCAYNNPSARRTCLMCDTSVGFLVSDRGTMLRHTSSSTFLGKESSEAMADDQRARQRALFKRRLNSMSTRKNLSQRQRGAIRRRLWERKQLSDGKFHWIRQNSSDHVGEVLPRATFLTGPNGECVEDLHMIRSQGFVWNYNERGQLEWTKADEVAIDMDSFRKMQLLSDRGNRGSRKQLEIVDYEGVMAMDFRLKKQWFLVQLTRIATPMTEAVSKLAIRRERLLKDSVEKMVTASPEALHTYLKISFTNEVGIDAGGLLREWFMLATKELFSDELGLFTPTKGENMSYWINPLSGEKNENHLQYFRFAGILIGKAIFEGLVLDVHLALPLLKHVLGVPISFSDLEFLDEELHRNCQWLRQNSNADALCLTFSIMMENGEEVDLKPDGRNIDVTDENKEEYLRLVLQHRMLGSISDQLQEFLTGIYDVVPKALLSVFDYQELELFLCGIPTIDTTDWRENTRIRYIPEDDNVLGLIKQEQQDAVIQWFWLVIEGLTAEERARLLQFTTGTSRVPVEGFKGLMSSSGIIHPFTIQLVRRGKKVSDLFPKAHTCFNRLDLPMYNNMEELENYLSMVMQMEISAQQATAMADGSSATVNMVLILMGAIVVLMFCAIIGCASYCKSDQYDYDIDMVDNRDLLLRENLVDTVIEDGKAEWQCIVCLHMNHPDNPQCNLCGASAESSTLSGTMLYASQSGRRAQNNSTAILSDTVLLQPSHIHTSFVGSTSFRMPRSEPMMPLPRSASADDEPVEVTASIRQRALRYRRLNQMQLNQRQRGAQRRRLWQRVHVPNGGYVWVRTKHATLTHQDSFVSKLRNNTFLSRNPHSSTLRGTIAEQLHRKNAASMGYFTEMNDNGVLSWKKADEVVVNVDTDTEDLLRDLDVDFEGLMSMSFREKKKWFVKKVASISVHFTDSVHKVLVRRDQLLEDSVESLSGDLPKEKCGEHLNITFEGEPGLDAGGVLREWFSLVCAELFSAEMGLFCTTHAENMSYWINPASGSVHEDHLKYFTFAGRVFGKAILDGLVFDVNFALPLLKHLLGVPITFSDLEFLDEELYRNCIWMHENDGVEALCVTFSVQTPEGKVIELKPGGNDIDVTDENKGEYMALLLQYRMLNSVAPQLTALLNGLYEIIPKVLLSVFDYQELDFFLCGLPVINLKDWKTNTRVRHYAPETDPVAIEREVSVVNWFWEVVEGFSDEERARLLQFATGSSRVPVEGFKALMSASGYVHPFTLQMVPPGEPPVGLFPRAHTCFNRVDLPIYEHQEDLMNYLTLVIQMEITGFGFE